MNSDSDEDLQRTISNDRQDDRYRNRSSSNSRSPTPDKKPKKPKEKTVKKAWVALDSIKPKTAKTAPPDSLLMYASSVFCGGINTKKAHLDIEGELRDIFEERGTIKNVMVIAGRGIAFVEFENYKDAVDSIAWFDREGAPLLDRKRLKISLGK